MLADQQQQANMFTSQACCRTVRVSVPIVSF
jgi:hypothetical protein